jgi:RNA polymerase sigma-70 factor (ECF subfamily)
MLTEKETEIIEGCRNGDRECQKCLYLTYGPLIKGICVRYTDDMQEAEDYFHDIFVFILTRFEYFNNITSLGGWIRTITINKCIDFLRHKKLKNAIPMSSLECDFNDASVHDYDGIPMGELQSFIAQLPENQRTAFNLYVIDGVKQEQIAKMMQMTQNNISTLISRARATLRKRINEYWNKEEKNEQQI